MSRRIILVAVLAGSLLASSALAQTAAQNELWKITPDGKGLARLADTPGYSCGSPEWSPDGQWVAYDTWPVGKSWSDARIGVVHADGTQLRLLGRGGMPSWSPDGTHIAYHTYDSPPSIVVARADGLGRETLINRWGSPRWSPRGNHIASIGPANAEITLFDLTTGLERTLIAPGPIRQGFSISPNGRRYCFAGLQAGLAVADFDAQLSKPKVRWLFKEGVVYHCSWAPDGKRIVFSWQPQQNTPHQLFLMDVDADTTPARLSGQDRGRINSNPDWAPDGKTIVFASRPAE